MLHVGTDTLRPVRVDQEDVRTMSANERGAVSTPGDSSGPSQVVCFGDGLSFGYYGRPICSAIDVRKAGPGKLSVNCDGPSRKALCELRDCRDGFFKLTVEANDIGNHLLYIRYNDEDVPGSPYFLRVSPASLIKVHGPGLQNGILSKYKAHFTVELGKVGPGDLTVKIGGPKGAFKVKTKKQGRNVLCSYEPKEPGHYVIHINWGEDPVMDSPFNIFLAANKKEMERIMALQSSA